MMVSWPNEERTRSMATMIGTTRYATAATACRFLSVLLVSDWRWRLSGMLLATADVVGAGGATSSLREPAGDSRDGRKGKAI